MHNSDSRNTSYARKGVFFLVRVLGWILGFQATDPKFRAILFPTRFQRNIVENFSLLGVIAAEK
jgi:hypothetical protein